MKMIVYSLLMLRLLELIIPNYPTTSLHELIAFTEVHDYQIESGELLIKESFNYEQLDQVYESIKAAGFHKAELNSESALITFQRQLSSEILEEITVIETNDNREVTVNYHLSGNVHQLINNAKFNQLIKSVLVTIYTREKREYACISLTNHGMMARGYFLKKLENNLQYEEIDRIVEPNLTVISAYSAKLSQAVPTKDKQMNLQISARQLTNNEISVLIGTPILTTEY